MSIIAAFLAGIWCTLVFFVFVDWIAKIVEDDAKNNDE